jgi:hypothetical protein
MFITRLAALAAIGLAMSGCASIVKGTTQTIAITTPPTTGANCVLTNAEGTFSVVSPGTVMVKRSKANIEVRCNKPGFQEGYGTIPSNFQGWTVGNIVAGGVIGLGVDAATGAINEYPPSFAVPMQPGPAAANPGQPTS